MNCRKPFWALCHAQIWDQKLHIFDEFVEGESSPSTPLKKNFGAQKLSIFDDFATQ